jgi:cytochrome P450
MRTALVTDFDDVTRVLRDEEFFIQDGYAEMGGNTLIHLNGAPHQRLRRLLVPTLGPRAVRDWEDRFVPGVLDGLLTSLEGEAAADLMQAVCNPYPVRVFRRIMDLPEEDTDKVHALGVLQIAASASEEARRYTVYLENYVRRHFRARRELPAEELAARRDLISLLAACGEGEDRLEEGEAVATLQLMVTGGVDTTANLLGNVLWYLLTQPAAIAAVREDRSLVPKAMEETLRLQPSGGNFELRIALQDTELQGVRIPRGTPVFTCETTANRDPKYWTDPDRFDLSRPQRQHLAFGQGPHTCIGMHLARMEVRMAVNAILDRFPALRLDPSEPVPEIRGFLFQHPTALPVLLREGAA